MSDVQRLVEYLRGYLHGMRTEGQRLAREIADDYARQGAHVQSAHWGGVADGMAMAADRIERVVDEWMQLRAPLGEEQES